MAEPANAVAGDAGQPLESINVLRSFLARGLVRSLPAKEQTVVVRHEDIPGFMPKMTMAFDVRETNELRGLKPGDAIIFDVNATEEDSWIENIQPAARMAWRRCLPPTRRQVARATQTVKMVSS